jgi:GNAT superfamily N-acetyltransferase
VYRIREVDTFADEDAVEAIHFFNRQTCAFPVLTQDTLEKGWWWVAYLDKAPVGFAGLTRSTYGPNVGYLKRAGVDPKHRGHGLQQRLIRVRLSKARRLGMAAIVTETTDTVYSANNLYKAGFKMFDPAVPWLEYKTTLYWIKKL